MTTQYCVQFCISLFDLAVFWHYQRGTVQFLTFRKENMSLNQLAHVH